VIDVVDVIEVIEKEKGQAKYLSFKQGDSATAYALASGVELEACCACGSSFARAC